MYISLIVNTKLHGLDPRYNLKQKYIALISSYNILEREDCKDKSNLLTIDLRACNILFQIIQE